MQTRTMRMWHRFGFVMPVCNAAVAPICTSLCLLFGIALAACATEANQANTQPVIRDSGIDVSQQVGSIVWLDNETVAFLALVPNVGRPWMLHSFNRLDQLTTWNVRTRVIGRHGDPGYGRVCFDGREVIQSDVEGTDQATEGAAKKLRYWLVSGPLERRSKRELTREQSAGFDFDTCRPQSELLSLPAGTSEYENGRRRLLRLRPEHGFLEFVAEQGAPYPIRLILPATNSGQPAVDLPALKGHEVFGLPLRFYPNRGAYLVKSIPPGSKPVYPSGQSTVNLWWLYPGGRLEKAATVRSPLRDSQPSELAVENASTAFIPVAINDTTPMARGYLVDGGTMTFKGDTEKLGLYHADRDSSTKLLSGLLTKIAVSPDGCRAALGVDDKNPAGPPERYRLYVIDTCKGDKK